MKKVFLSVGWCIFVLIAVAVTGEGVHATSWSEGRMNIVSRSVTTFGQNDGMYACMGLEQPISVSTYGEISAACVYGNSYQFRFARFFHSGAYRYAISHPHQNEFYEVRGVCGKPGCVYSPDSDVFIEHKYIGNNMYGATMHKNFSKKMLRQIDPSSLKQYYLLNTDDEFGTVVGFENNPLRVEALNISNNGKWAVVELPTFGIIRIDTETMNIRRVVAPGADYGLFNDPQYELVISDDGKYIATTGYRAPTGMVEVDAFCGDTFTASTGSHFKPLTIPCVHLPLNFSALFPSMNYGFRLRFNNNNQRLAISILHNDGKMERVILSPDAIHKAVNYISLGDSFTSGEGELKDEYYKQGTNDEKLKCHVSSRSYPYLIAERWGIKGESVACSGARTVDLIGENAYKGQNGILEKLADHEKAPVIQQAINTFRSGVVRQSQFVSHYQPDLVSIGIGGNDAGLVGKLAACLGPGDCEWVTNKEKIFATSREIADVYPKIRETIRQLRQMSPNTKYFSVGYPRIINEHSDAPCDITTKALLSLKERVFINESIKYLNDVVKAASRAENVRFVDIEDSFVDHNLCGKKSSSMMNGVRMGDDIAPPIGGIDFRIFGSESYHPTPKGHQAIADAILTTFSSIDKVSDCSECNYQSSLPEPSEYWVTPGTESYARQFEDTSLSKEMYLLGEKIIINTEALLFMKDTEVAAELHSSPTVLARGLVNEDGSFSFESVIPKNTAPGYHTLHLLGVAPDGTKVDVYRTIAVQSKEYIPTQSSPALTENVQGKRGDLNTNASSQPAKLDLASSPTTAASTATLLETPSVIRLKNSIANPKLAKDTNVIFHSIVWAVGLLFASISTCLVYRYVKKRMNNSRDS